MLNKGQAISNLTNLREKKIDNYLLLEKLGQGQFGEVFKAQNIITKKFYAIKKLKKSNIERNPILKTLLQTEVSIMHSINHPNIIHLYEYLETQNSYYLVMDYCNNGDFNNYLKLKKKKYLEEREAVFFLKQIMNGFQELRKNKILHRDFKLANIFVNDDLVVIGDFGLAKAGSNLAETIIGTPLTMAYEILKEKGVYNSKADLWSVGVVYYQLLFGEYPFIGMSKFDLIQDIDNTLDKGIDFPETFSVSEQSKDLIRGLLVRDPELRLDWKDFFNHPLFKVYDTTPLKGESLMKSISINKEFEKNKKSEDIVINVDFFDENSLAQKQNFLQPKNINEKNLEQTNENELIFREIKFRYNHEKNKILFIVKTVKRIQNSVINNYFLPVKKTIMNISIFLLKKAQILNNLNMFHLKQGNNVYSLNNQLFEEIKASSCYTEIIDNFARDKTNLDGYFEMLLERCKKIKISIENIYFLKMETPQLSKLDDYLKRWYKDLANYIEASEMKDFVKKDIFLRQLIMFKFCIYTENTFSYLNSESGQKFNWNKFYESCETSSLHELKLQI